VEGVGRYVSIREKRGGEQEGRQEEEGDWFGL
jgi:hypothetical protein